MSALLPAAADVILTNGFVQAKFFQVKLDDDTGWRPNRKCPVCPRGAIAIAAGQEPDFMVMLDERGLTAPEADAVAYAEIRDAERVLIRYLREQLGYAPGTLEPDDPELIEFWADESGRTQPQVVGALRAAYEYAGRPA